MVYMVWYCSWSYNYLYGPFHRAQTVQHCPAVTGRDNIILSRLRWENVDRDKVARWHHKTNRWSCLCGISVSLPPTFSYSRWRMNCENNERIYDHKLENLSSEMQTSHLFWRGEGGGRPGTKNWPSHGRNKLIVSERRDSWEPDWLQN